MEGRSAEVCGATSFVTDLWQRNFARRNARV